MAFHQLVREDLVRTDLDSAWTFLSRPENLGRITPPSMRFTVVTPNLPEVMYPGMMIAYRITPLPGIRLTWVTEITQIREKAYFVDEQRCGPYALWHHEHFLQPVEGGVMMADIVSYRLPAGPLGELAHALFIRRKLASIFDYRREALHRIFPG